MPIQFGIDSFSPEKENAEYGNENDAQLVERRDACGVAELQGSEVAQPGCAGGEA